MGRPPIIPNLAMKARSFKLGHEGSEQKPYRIRYNDKGRLDEIVANPSYVNLEQMDDDFWWLGIMTGQGDFIHVYLTSKRKIKANVLEYRVRRSAERSPAGTSVKDVGR
jgi:hypothetical protein